jgi:uncharacterized membrane protein YfcA
MEILGYFFSIIIGVLLGLIGGGGSILAVPLLVYLFKIDAVIATSYSLFIVGVSSYVGVVNFLKKNLVDLKTAFLFGIPSIVTIYITRSFLLPQIPAHIISINTFTLTKNMFLMLFFSMLMFASSLTMLKKNSTKETTTAKKNFGASIIVGLFVGIVSGLVGAGGGFIIIPALVFFLNLPIKKAIGTSLLIIALNSTIGFLSNIKSIEIDIHFLLFITSLSTLGMLIGIYLSNRIAGENLKPMFAWFVMLIAVLILYKEII